jgi:hypothetical protein
MGEVTREELAAMTDQELLAYEREHHGDPYMSLLKAKRMQRVALSSGMLGRPERRRTGRPRRGRGVACFRSCFRPTPLLAVSSAAELNVAKAFRTRRCGGGLATNQIDGGAEGQLFCSACHVWLDCNRIPPTRRLSRK